MLLFPALCYSQASSGSEDILKRAQQLRWWEEKQWHRLVQYEKKWWSGFESPAEFSGFFLAVDGKNNPESELLETIRAFQNNKKIKSKDGKFEDPAICVFPARKMWIEKISGSKFPHPPCERYERFLEILKPQSLTYVFSSYYLNNPASAFGHTFLRINKGPSSRDGERYELFDYGVGYAAVKVSENPFVYSFLGVSGLMPGAFDINPYYFKVREYNDFESRDIWEYDLNFTPEEVQFIVAYIWELLNANFNYHYFSENCAYRILSVLETAREDLNLTSKLKSQVMPADTVQTLFESQGLVGQIHYRPSVRATFYSRYNSLNAKEQLKLIEFARTEAISHTREGLSLDEQRDVLDTAIDYLDFRYPKQILRKEGKYHFKKELLLARAELGGISDPVKVDTPWKEAPHQAQGSRRWGVGYRSWEGESSYLLDYKLSLHDLLDPKIGYPPMAEITMGDLFLVYSEESKRVDLDKFTFYEVISLSPVDSFNRGISWRLKVAYESGYESNCDSFCRWMEISGGSGSTFTFWNDLDVALWLKVTTLTSPELSSDHWILGAGPTVTVRWNRGWFALLGESYYRYDYRGTRHEFRQSRVGLNFSINKSLSLRIEGRDDNDLQRLDTRLLYYY